MLLSSMADKETNSIEIMQLNHEPFVKDCMLMNSFHKIANLVFSISFDVLFMYIIRTYTDTSCFDLSPSHCQIVLQNKHNILLLILRDLLISYKAY